MDILIKAGQFLLSLSILIVLHEFGHFIPARLFGTRVEKFYLFFNPKFSLFKKKIGETEWGIGWIPLGGYVKISGMIDESMDKEQMEKPPEPWEFRSKPAWQRLIIMLGGVIVNVIVGFVIYIMVAGVWGDNRIDPKTMPWGVQVDSVMMNAGVQNGDRILAVNGEVANSIQRVNEDVMFLGARDLTIKRGDEEVQINLPEDIDYDLIKSGAKMPFNFVYKPVIDTILPDGACANSGLMKGDLITKVDGKAIEFWHNFTAIIQASAGNTTFEVDVLRNGEPLKFSLTTNEESKLGIGPESDMTKYYDVIHMDYSFTEAFPAGWEKGKRKIASYTSALKHIFTKAGVKQMGGFISMGKVFSPTWDWESFWTFTAFLSLVLAVMNILPIPALDGGHVLFLLYEMVTGREPNKKFMEIAQYVGMILLIGLLLFANGNDVIKLFK